LAGLPAGFSDPWRNRTAHDIVRGRSVVMFYESCPKWDARPPSPRGQIKHDLRRANSNARRSNAEA
jgi:hypothetical protein